MINGNRITRTVLACHGNGHRACRQGTHVRRRDRRTPGAVSQDGRRVGFIVHGDGQRRARRQPVACTRNNQVLIMFDAVDHIVARDGIDAQPRQVSVDSDIALSGAAVTHAVGYAGRYGQLAVAQRCQFGLRHVNGPGEIALDRRGIRFASECHGNRVACFGIDYRAADALACRQFSRVNDVIARHGVDNDPRQNGLDIHGMRGTGAVANAVRC